MSIDWARFAQRVAAGTMVRWQFMAWGENLGMLLETYPFSEIDQSYDPTTSAVHDPKTGERYAEHLMVQPLSRHMTPDKLNKNPEELEYLIDGQWLDFDTIMRDTEG